MAKLAKMTALKTTSPQKETQLDKTTRIVRKINDEEAEVRHIKTARLRKARFDSEEDAPVDANAAIATGHRNSG